MKIVFTARDLNEAHIVSGLLNANGIETHVGGHYLQGGIGELAASDFATVLVADDEVDKAATIIASYDGNDAQRNAAAGKKRNSYFLPLIVIAFCLLLIIVLSIIFSGR